MDLSLVQPTGIYFIIERIYPRDGLIPGKLSIGEISPSLAQIHRMVISVSTEQEMYMNGMKLDPSNISLWQTIKYSFGTPVETKSTGKIVYNIAFAGSLVSITLSPDSDMFDIPKGLTKPRVKRLPRTINLGKDPVPEVVLYGRKNIKFFMDNGGLDTPTAIAKYNKKTKELMTIQDKIALKKLMQDLVKSGVVL